MMNIPGTIKIGDLLQRVVTPGDLYAYLISRANDYVRYHERMIKHYQVATKKLEPGYKYQAKEYRSKIKVETELLADCQKNLELLKGARKLSKKVGLA